MYMKLETQETEKGVKIFLETNQKAAVLIKDGEKERILLPITDKVSESTYYYENSSGLAKTSEGYVGFYQGNPDFLKVLN